MAVEEIPASAEKQETSLPTSSNSLPLTPITTIYDNPTYQDSPLPSSDQLEGLFCHPALDPFPFLDPSASNHVPLPPATAAGSLVSSINGETSSSSSSSWAQQEPPLLSLNNTFQVPYVWVNRPPPMFYKLNVAVVPCVVERIEFLGLGVVVRDHFAVVHQALSFIWNQKLNQSLGLAELYVYSLGIRLCINHFPRLIAETEGFMLVRRHQQDYNPDRFDFFQAMSVSPDDNRLARAFAEMALQIDNVFWTPEQIIKFFGTVVLPF